MKDKIKYKDYDFGGLNVDYKDLTNAQKIERLKLLGHRTDDPIVKEFKNSIMTAKNEARRSKQLRSHPQSISDHQINVILDTLSQNNTEASLLLALTLFTGQNIVEHPQLIQYELNAAPYFEFEIQIASQLPNPSLTAAKYYQKTIERMNLPLPEVFADYAKRQQSAEQTCEELLDKINAKLNKKITLSEVANYMNHWMSVKGFDSAEIALLMNKPKEYVTALSYYGVNSEALHQKYEEYLAHVMSIKGEEYEQRQPLTSGWIGSKLVLKDETIESIFSFSAQKINEFKILDNAESIHKHHNWLSLYTLLVLNLSTGHRPVNHPYHSLSCIDLNSNQIFIHDKNKKERVLYRVLYMPQLAVEQLCHYLAHLKKLEERLFYTDRPSALIIQNILTGSVPLFYFFESSLKLSDDVNEALKSIFLPNFDVQTNWHRHYMRSKLRSEGIAGQCVDMWMGHEGKGGYGIDESSACGVDELQPVAQMVQKILESLSIESIEGNML